MLDREATVQLMMHHDRCNRDICIYYSNNSTITPIYTPTLTTRVELIHIECVVCADSTLIMSMNM